jgi:hypothetical protein
MIDGLNQGREVKSHVMKVLFIAHEILVKNTYGF